MSKHHAKKKGDCCKEFKKCCPDSKCCPDKKDAAPPAKCPAKPANDEGCPVAPKKGGGGGCCP